MFGANKFGGKNPTVLRVVTAAVVGLGTAVYSNSEADKRQKSAIQAQQSSMSGAVGGLASAYMTQQQSDAMMGATNQAVQEADPFAQSRQLANQQLQALMQSPGSMQNDPAGQWAMQQGRQAVDRSLAAKHMTASGNALTELTQWGQGLANQQYNSRLGQLASMASQGASPAVAAQARLQGTGQAVGLSGQASGQAINSAQNLGNSIGGAIGGIGNAIGGYSSGSSTPSNYTDPNASVWNSPYANSYFSTPQAGTNLYDTGGGYSTGGNPGGYTGLGYGDSTSMFSF